MTILGAQRTFLKASIGVSGTTVQALKATNLQANILAGYEAGGCRELGP